MWTVLPNGLFLSLLDATSGSVTREGTLSTGWCIQPLGTSKEGPLKVYTAKLYDRRRGQHQVLTSCSSTHTHTVSKAGQHFSLKAFFLIDDGHWNTRKSKLLSLLSLIRPMFFLSPFYHWLGWRVYWKIGKLQNVLWNIYILNSFDGLGVPVFCLPPE